jgi:UDPglucose 6-dehydrogenase
MALKLENTVISVIGTGYVGLITAIGFTTKNFGVIATDCDKLKVKSIKKGVLPFYEPNIQPLLQKALLNKKLVFAANIEKTILNSDITFISTGTPSLPDGSINLQYIIEVAENVGSALKKKGKYHTVIVKSTVTPTTTEKIIKPLLETKSNKRCGRDFGLCFNPEFLREGSALQDILQPDRLIIGEYDERCGDTLEGLYRNFYEDHVPPILRTNLANAELIKYASNAFLATKISFVNTLANICEKTPGADVKTVAKGISFDKRIGSLFLNAGLGYGGSCFPKDLKALVSYAKKLGYDPILLDSVQKVNNSQPLKAVNFCRNFLANLKNKHIAILGLAFKPDTSDMREAISIPLINQLLKEGVHITAYDPAALPTAKLLFGDKIVYASSAIQTLKDADCCILVTEWDEFKKLQPDDFVKNMKQAILIDGRRIYNKELFNKKMKFAAIGAG